MQPQFLRGAIPFAAISSRRDILARIQMPSAFAHIIVAASQSFPAFSKNESLRLQSRQPLSALITANEPLIRYQGKDRSDD
jgi:hypothetical protein